MTEVNVLDYFFMLALCGCSVAVVTVAVKKKLEIHLEERGETK